MPNTRVKSNDPRALDWLYLTDFTAGIQAPRAQRYAPNSNVMLLSTPDKPAAIMGQTFGCYALPGGGITSLPGAQTGKVVTPSSIALSGTQTFITGILSQNQMSIVENINPSVQNNYFYTYLYRKSSNNVVVMDFILDGSAGNTNIETLNNESADTIIQPFPNFPFIAVINNGSTIDPYIGCSFSQGPNSGDFSGGSLNNLIDATQGIGSGRRGWFFSHQGRILFVEYQSPSSLTSSNVQLVSFTDPPESATLGNQQSIFMPITTDDISCFGSLSSGDLLVLTRNSGGFILSGDVFSPFITTVPGVQGTGSLFGKGALAPNGLVYISGEAGAWVWGGGSNSQKISEQIPDNFYNMSGKYSQFNLFCVGYWNNWILFQDNWIFDTVTGSWWQLSDPTLGISYFHYAPFSDLAIGNGFYAAPYETTAPALPTIDYFTTSILTQSWTWSSQPMIISNGEVCEVDELILTLSGSGTVQVLVDTLTGQEIQVDPITLNSNAKPQQFRIPCRIQSDVIMITVEVTNASQNTPTTLHRLAIGYRTRWHLATI